MTDDVKTIHGGFVRLVDVMGDDAAIVQAARISYGAGTKTTSGDRTLLRYLMRHRHTTPFEMAEMKFHIRIPMDIHRQLVRHRTASINEYSTRYSEAIDACQFTKEDEWRAQSTQNKQGSDEQAKIDWPESDSERHLVADSLGLESFSHVNMTTGEYLSRREALLIAQARAVYEERLRFGVAREQARKDLPLSTYTELYWKIDLHNLFHFLSLRLDSHAQLEIRQYAQAIAEFVKVKFPLSWEAFENYRLNALTFSQYEIDLLGRLYFLTARNEMPAVSETENMSKRELTEFWTKFSRIVTRGIMQSTEENPNVG